MTANQLEAASVPFTRRISKLLVAAICAVGCAAPRRAAQLDPMLAISVASCPPLTAPRLVFQSDFWLNLHNFLAKEAKRRSGIDDDGAGARGNTQADTLGLRALTPAERAVWDRALRFYAAKVLSHQMGGDSVVTGINDRLAVASEESLAGAAVDSSLAETLGQAAPIYRAVWWPIHDAHNTAWISASRGLVDRYGGCVFPTLQHALRRPWPSEPIVIHASTYASWFGAYTTTATGPNVTISTNAVGNQETYALESILHESAHAARLLETGEAAMATDAANHGIHLEPELSHVLLFYTTGDIIAGIIPSHVPYAERFGIWARTGEMQRLKGVLAESWQPYLSGTTSFERALDAVVEHSRR